MKRSVVLVGVKNEKNKGVLTIEEKNEGYEGRVRLYNFNDEPEGILSIGFYHNGKVNKVGMTKTATMFYTFYTEQDLSDKFSCAVVNFKQGELRPLLFGTLANVNDRERQINRVIDEVFEQPIQKNEIEKVLDKENISYSEEYQQEIDGEISKAMNDSCVDCATCKYKQAFYEKNEAVNVETKNIENKKFLGEISGQIEELFDKNAREELLEQIIPNSKWVKVSFETEDDYYILGLIYENDNVKYVVYGVPGIFQNTPPKEIAGYPVWFPLDKERSDSFGYWLSYQDADTGESIKAVVE